MEVSYYRHADLTGYLGSISTIDSIANGMVRLWYMMEEFVRNIGPGTSPPVRHGRRGDLLLHRSPALRRPVSPPSR